jgi:hypothetical protein
VSSIDLPTLDAVAQRAARAAHAALAREPPCRSPWPLAGRDGLGHQRAAVRPRASDEVRGAARRHVVLRPRRLLQRVRVEVRERHLEHVEPVAVDRSCWRTIDPVATSRCRRCAPPRVACA